ncbi:MAG: hypothetical protein C5B56_09405 [Proteobacteria bacterium]|nr:MAG: hypothetical protein C5B56_09405 [Pseudomonadota bacterium]
MRDRETQIQFLEQAERHIAEGELRIAEQAERVARLRRHGHDVTEADRLLTLFRDTQAQQLAHRDLILKELTQ